MRRSHIESLLLGALVVVGLAVSPAGAATIFTTNFEASAPAEIGGAGSRQSTASLPAGFGSWHWRNDSTGNPASATTLSLTGLGTHTQLKITFDFIAWDSWDGNDFPNDGGAYIPDYLNVTLDSSSVFSNFYRNVPGTNIPAPPIGTGILIAAGNFGYGGRSPWDILDVAWRITLTIPHSAATANFAFFASGTGWQGGTDESIGLDNIVVESNVDEIQPIPEPGTLILLGAGLAASRLRRRAR